MAFAATMAMVAPGTQAQPPTTTPSELVARFDQVVNEGLPARIELTLQGTRKKREAGRDSDTLVIESRLPADIVFADGVHSEMFSGALGGKPVAMTRRDDHLDISIPKEDGMHVIGFTTNDPVVERIRVADTGLTGDPAVPLRRERREIDTNNNIVNRTVTLNMFVHDDVMGYMTPEHVHAGYVAWWLDDALRTTMPFTKIDVTYHSLIRGVTDIPYMHAKALIDWTRTAKRWAEEEDIAYEDTHLNKFMLITLLPPESKVTGIAWQEGNSAMSAISGRYRIVAHELGHLFGAVHENGAIQYKSGWWCESNMYPFAWAFRSNCYTYSDDNQRRMRAYIVEGTQWPDSPEGGPPVVN
ncbi:MAG: hypothetical protein GAK28_03688 [Luteibacter sp.]|nr:MAG: hypothetical protein GAK28_03688 [Luteibacter sp.]